MTLTLRRGLTNDPVMSLPARPFVAVLPADSIRHAVDAMNQLHTGCALVTRDNRLVGIFTERDFISRVIARGLDVNAPVEQVMTPDPIVLRQTDSVLAAVEFMERRGMNHLPIVDDHAQPVSVLSARDLIHYLVEYFPATVYNLPETPEVAQASREGA